MNDKPFVLVSFAQTLDGALSTADARPLAISNAYSTLITHALRGRLDAILIGVGTALADDPVLSCRAPSLAEALGAQLTRPRFGQPRRIVLDPRLELPLGSRMLADLDRAPLTLFYYPPSLGPDGPSRRAALERPGLTLVPTKGPRADWEELNSYLLTNGMKSLFIEGGGRVIASALEADVADALIITLAPRIQGGPKGWYSRELPRGFALEGALRAGDDMVLEYRPSGNRAAAPYRSLEALARELGFEPGVCRVVSSAV